MTDSGFGQRVAAVRRFNRFYTQKIGVLDERLWTSPFSLAEVRVLYELAHGDKPTATEIARDLSLDAGYLSRILRGFATRGLIRKEPSTTDGRQSLLSLTEKGRKVFAPIEARSHEQIGAMLGELSPAEQERLVEAAHTIEGLLGAPAERRVPYILRPHRPGDIGWIVHRHGVLYAREYGWDERFEAMVADIAARFVQRYDPQGECCWIAEKDGEVVGSVLLVRQAKTLAKLRLLLVEPKARGLGIGGRLVEECIRFARRAGYRKITLLTNSVLLSARRIYEAAGFRLTRRDADHSFGHDMVWEAWTLKL